jgi:hypothetical protein
MAHWARGKMIEFDRLSLDVRWEKRYMDITIRKLNT